MAFNSMKFLAFMRCHHNYHSLSRLNFIFLKADSVITMPPVPRRESRNFSLSSYVEFVSTLAPVLELQKVLVNAHEFSGLPWWAVISLSTLSVRTFITFPLAVHQYQVSARLENVHGELAKLAPELNKEVTIAARMQNWDLRTTKLVYKRNIKRFYNEFIVRDNCHPFKGIVLIFVQVPVWICFSAALRNISFMMPYHDRLAEKVFNQLTCEGTLWFPDLTLADGFFIPVLIGAINLTLIQMHSLRNQTAPSLIQKIIKNGARALTITVSIIASSCPTSMSFYWLCSSLCGLLQNTLLMSPKARRFFRIPSCKSESSTPYKDIYVNLKKKISSK